MKVLEWMNVVVNAILFDQQKKVIELLFSKYQYTYNSPPGRRGTIGPACLVSAASDDIVDRGQQQRRGAGGVQRRLCSYRALAIVSVVPRTISKNQSI